MAKRSEPQERNESDGPRFRPGFQFDEGEAMRAGCKVLTGKEVATVEEAIAVAASMNFDLKMMKLGAKTAYFTLVGRASYGCRQSAQFIIERLFGQADKSFAEAANDLSHHEVMLALHQYYRGLGYDEKYAWELVERDRQSPMVALPELVDVTPR